MSKVKKITFIYTLLFFIFINNSIISTSFADNKHYKNENLLNETLSASNEYDTNNIIYNNHSFKSIDAESEMLTGINTGLSGDDYASNNLPIGFSFFYWGKEYTNFGVSINGWIGFPEAYGKQYENADFPTTSKLNGLIAAFFDDLITHVDGEQEGVIRYLTIGNDDEKNRKLVIQYNDMYFFGTKIPMGTFEIILFENTNEIKFQYRYLKVEGAERSLWNSATIGIDDPNSDDYIRYSFNQASLNEKQAISFVPDGQGRYSMNSDAPFEWIDISGLTVYKPIVNGQYTNSDMIKFSWFEIQGANAYRLDISTSESESDIITSVKLDNVLEYNFSQLIENNVYYARVAASFNNGNTYQNPSFFSNGITVDYTAPIPKKPEINPLENGEIQLILDAEEKHKIQTYHIQLANNVSFSNPLISTTISKNEYIYEGNIDEILYARYYAVDAAGNTGEFGDYAIVTYTLPDLAANQITWEPSLNLNSGDKITIKTTIQNNGNKSLLIPFQVDFFINGQSIGVQNINQTIFSGSSILLHQNWTAISGSHTVSVVVDSLNDVLELDENNNSVSNDLVVLDATPPETQISLDFADNYRSCSTTVNICWTGNDDSVPPENLKYSYSIDNTEWSNWISYSCYQYSNLSDGSHIFKVKAKDSYENEDNSPAELNFFIDTTAPIISNIVVIPMQSSALVTWTTSEPSTTQIEYSTTTDYGLASIDMSMVNNHSVAIKGLKPETDYHFKVISYDGCNKAMADDRLFTTTSIQLPDLIISELNIPTSATYSKPFKISWRVKNTGMGDAEGSWKDSIYLSTDNTLSDDDVLLKEINISEKLTAYFDYRKSTTVQLLDEKLGLYYIIIKTDNGKNIEETDDGNNVLSKLIHLAIPKYITVTPELIKLKLNTEQAVSGKIDIVNLGSKDITGINRSITNLSENINLQFDTLSNILGLSSKKLSYTITALDESILSNKPSVTFKSNEGQEFNLYFEITIIPKAPKLIANPGYLETTMLRGSQKNYEFEVSNIGGLVANNLQVFLPQATWLSLISAKDIYALDPDDKTKIVLMLKPDENIELGPYTGDMLITGNDVNLSINFKFTAVSESKGSLKIIAKDELSYYADDHPNVANAQVIIKDAFSEALIDEGITDESGIFITNEINEGRYNIEVQAEKHSIHRSIIEVAGGQENEVTAFLAKQMVTYNWIVEPIEYEDHYRITIEAVFETYVPAPVVTVDPIFNVVPLYEGETTTVTMTITNHGLIQVNDVIINFPDNEDIYIEPLTSKFSVLSAKSSVVVPIMVRDKKDGPIITKQSIEKLDSSPVVCLPANVTYWYDSGYGVRENSIPLNWSYIIKAGQVINKALEAADRVIEAGEVIKLIINAYEDWNNEYPDHSNNPNDRSISRETVNILASILNFTLKLNSNETEWIIDSIGNRNYTNTVMKIEKYKNLNFQNAGSSSYKISNKSLDEANVNENAVAKLCEMFPFCKEKIEGNEDLKLLVEFLLVVDDIISLKNNLAAYVSKESKEFSEIIGSLALACNLISLNNDASLLAEMIEKSSKWDIPNISLVEIDHCICQIVYLAFMISPPANNLADIVDASLGMKGLDDCCGYGNIEYSGGGGGGEIGTFIFEGRISSPPGYVKKIPCE